MKKLFLFFVVCILLVGTISYLWVHRVTKKIFVESPRGKQAVSLPTTLQGYFDKQMPFNVLVLGYGGGNHDGAYLTDTIIVAHVDPKIKKVFLVSIPRDIWVKVPTEGNDGRYWKINAAYALGLDDRQYPNKLSEYKGDDGAGRLAEYVVGQVTGQTIPYFVGLNFSGFTHTIDTLGGVDINVQPAFTDPEYPLEGKEAELCDHAPEEIPELDKQAATTSAELVYPCRYETLHFDAGQQHMDGSTALKYVRSRHSPEDGSDFGRAQRQRKLILAIKQKVFSVGFISQVVPFMNSLGGDFKTDLAIADVQTLVRLAGELSGYSVETIALTDENYLMETISENGQNILSSKDGVDHWDSVHTWLTNTFAGLPVPAVARALVVNSTNTTGLAQYATDRLQSLHIQVRPPKSGLALAEKTSLTVYDPTIPETDIAILQKEFGTKAIIKSEATPSAYNVLITLGADYQPAPSPTP